MDLIYNIAIGLAIAFGLKWLLNFGTIAVVGNPSYAGGSGSDLHSTAGLMSTTLRNYRDKMVDNLSTATPFYWWLTRNNRVRKESSGLSIEVQMLYGLNDTVRSYSGYGIIDTTPQEGMTVASYPWKQVAGTITISGREMLLNKGKHRQINLLKGKTRQLEISIQRQMSTQFLGLGVGNNSQDFFGLELLVEDGTAWGTLAGIDRNDAGNAWWRNQFRDNANVAFGDNSTGAGYKGWRTDYNNASLGNEHPDFVLTTQTLYESYENGLAPQERYTDTKIGDAGFEALKFKGAWIFYDAEVPAGYVWMLNSDYIELVQHEDCWLTPGEFIETPTQDAISSKNLSMGNVVISNAARHNLTIQQGA